MNVNKNRNKKVKTQLGVFILIVVVYTVVEIVGITTLHFKYVNIDRESFNSINSISQMRSSLNQINNDSLKILSVNDANKKTELKDAVENEITECLVTINKYKVYDKSDEEAAEFNDFNNSFDVYVKDIRGLLEDVQNVDKNGLYKKVDSTGAQLTESLASLYKLSDDHHTNKMRGAALQRDITSNGTTLVSIIFLVVLFKIDRKRMKTEKELIQTEEKVVKQKKKISTAVLKDVLTETENRMSFINRFAGDNAKINEGYAYYFIMFDIDDFSSVNSTYGVKSGDLILNSSANKIMNVFEGSAVYRTGSDEFVVALSTTSDAAGYNRVTNLIEKAREALNTAHKIKSGSLIVSYSVSVVKKTGPCTVDSTVLGTLKESLKQGRMTQPGTVMFTELN